MTDEQLTREAAGKLADKIRQDGRAGRADLAPARERGEAEEITPEAAREIAERISGGGQP